MSISIGLSAILRTVNVNIRTGWYRKISTSLTRIKTTSIVLLENFFFTFGRHIGRNAVPADILHCILFENIVPSIAAIDETVDFLQFPSQFLLCSF